MQESHKSTRLGNLLVDKGKITRQQLFEAIRFQQEQRQFEIQHQLNPSVKNELGEILIELGFISRDELKQSLSWQKRLRKTTLALTFFAPLFTVACGGGGAAGSTSAVAGVKQTSSYASSLNPTVTSSSSSSNRAILSSSSISSNVKSSAASSSSTTSSIIDGAVLINWTPPTQRENGDYLDIGDIGGYELRYKLKSETQFTRIMISNGYTDSYYFNHLKGDYQFEIAAFDKTGLYSDFVAVQ